MTSLSSKFQSSVLYLLLSVGIFFPEGEEAANGIVYVVIFILALAAFVRAVSALSGTSFVFKASILYFFIFLVFFPALLGGGGVYALNKILGMVIVPYVATLIIVSQVVARGAEEFVKDFLLVCLGVLLVTLLYKAAFGFFNRGTRYFINGAIVFGWLMGVAALFALLLSFQRKKYRFLFILFSVATVWSFSKGPLVALAGMSALIIVLRTKQFKGFLFYAFLAVVLVYLLYLFQDVPPIARMFLVFRTDVDVLDVGSVDARAAMVEASLPVIAKYWGTGVGLGNWGQYVTWGGAIYPHNIVVEMMTEVGLPVFALWAMFFVISMWFATSTYFAYPAIFLLACGLFSGDMTYGRMLMSMLSSGLLLGINASARRTLFHRERVVA